MVNGVSGSVHKSYSSYKEALAAWRSHCFLAHKNNIHISVKVEPRTSINLMPPSRVCTEEARPGQPTTPPRFIRPTMASASTTRSTESTFQFDLMFQSSGSADSVFLYALYNSVYVSQCVVYADRWVFVIVLFNILTIGHVQVKCTRGSQRCHWGRAQARTYHRENPWRGWKFPSVAHTQVTVCHSRLLL